MGDILFSVISGAKQKKDYKYSRNINENLTTVRYYFTSSKLKKIEAENWLGQ